MVIVRGRLAPEAGAVLMQALTAARETLYRQTINVSAETSDDVPAEMPSVAQQQADALAHLDARISMAGWLGERFDLGYAIDV